MHFTDQSRQRAETAHDNLVRDDATEVWGRRILTRVGNMLLTAADESEPWKARLHVWRERHDADASWFTEVGEFALAELALIGAMATIANEGVR